MRVVASALLWVAVGLGVWACTSSVRNNTPDGLAAENTSAVSGTQAATSTQNAANGTSASNTVGGTTQTTSGGNVVTAANASNVTTGTGTGGSTSNATVTGTTGVAQCTDLRHPDHLNEDCSVVATWGECDNEWLQGYCDLSCGRCSAPTTSGGGGATSTSSTSDTTSTATTSTTATSTTSSSTTGQLGDDNPWGDVSNGQQGWASRYWDCCKPSCGWSGNASNPVKSCDKNDNSLGVSDETNSCELNGDSGAYTCHSMAPWAYSNQVSLGFAAINGVQCGSCFHIQFTGSSHNAPNDPGSAAIAGKSMIVMASNIGGIEQGQFDLLIPGGGVGALNGCAGQWGVSNSELGAQYGGFLSECKGESLDATKSCMRNKCADIFQTRGLSELYDGCIWFVDWFQAADNPSFTYQPIDCPQELVNAAH